MNAATNSLIRVNFISSFMQVLTGNFQMPALIIETFHLQSKLIANIIDLSAKKSRKLSGVHQNVIAHSNAISAIMICAVRWRFRRLSTMLLY